MSSHNKHLHSSEAGLLVWVTPFYFLNPTSKLPCCSGNFNQGTSGALFSLLVFANYYFSRDLVLVCKGCANSTKNWVP